MRSTSTDLTKIIKMFRVNKVIEENQKIKFIRKLLKNPKCTNEIDKNSMSKISMLRFNLISNFQN